VAVVALPQVFLMSSGLQITQVLLLNSFTIVDMLKTSQGASKMSPRKTRAFFAHQEWLAFPFQFFKVFPEPSIVER